MSGGVFDSLAFRQVSIFVDDENVDCQFCCAWGGSLFENTFDVPMKQRHDIYFLIVSFESKRATFLSFLFSKGLPFAFSVLFRSFPAEVNRLRFRKCSKDRG